MQLLDSPVSLFVISDLHLGGRPAEGDKPAFQMCTAEGRQRLRMLLLWLASEASKGERAIHLVIAGDIVDFLAQEMEGGFSAFTADDTLATAKLRAILEGTSEIWAALAGLVAAKGRLTLMLGNHDLELSLPGPRQLLLETLGPGHVEFIYDNQAFTMGHAVLVEHGNRYDDWNAVPHDDLREVRSRVSRGEAGAFDPLPGSRMVVELVNPTKKQLSFVDLLKPEDAALLPFLALLAPDRYKQISRTLKNRIRALRVRYNADGQPKDRNFVRASTGEVPETPLGLGTGDAKDDALLELAEEAAAGGDPANAAGADASVSFFHRWQDKLSAAFREKQLNLVLKVLRAWRGASERAFDVAQEDDKYLRPATETAARGYRVVVYGHTHLAKRVHLGGRIASGKVAVPDGAFYYNSGTWADLMAVPDAIVTGDTSGSDAREHLRRFIDDLAANNVDCWRRRLPTFVRVDLAITPDGRARVESSALQMLDAAGRPIEVTTNVMRDVMQGKRPS